MPLDLESETNNLNQNHVGHFLWTNLLLPRVLAAGPHARIVNTSSTGYTTGDVRLDDYNFDVCALLSEE
jgi:NAD(P)-dependent dehydrogenase (short-subunit alcohol dehydrogenase family)